MFLSIYAALFIVLIPGLYRLSKIAQRPPGYPPGPPTLPIIGNLHQMPGSQRHLQFKKWADTYGPVYCLMLGTKPWIVVSDGEVVNDLFVKDGGKYDSRPDMELANIVSGYNRMLLMSGEMWRTLRKIAHKVLKKDVSEAYVPYQDLETKALLADLLDTPELFDKHIRRLTNSLSTQMIYHFRTPSIDDPKLLQLYDGFEKFCEVASSRTAALVDVFPRLGNFLGWFIPVKSYAKKLHQKEKDLYLGHWNEFKENLNNNTAKSCICHAILTFQKKVKGLSDILAAYTAGSFLEAGSDTTAATLLGFMQAMVLFPDVRKIVQAEIDEVCGNRLPTLDDMPNLPFVCGSVKEAPRWMATVPLGVPYVANEDNFYRTYMIPKGATVICNVWSIHMDPKCYPNPHEFNPARYGKHCRIVDEAATNSSKHVQYTFGMGRRSCQGVSTAERTMFLYISRVLWGFNIDREVDANGNEIVPDSKKLTEGLFVQPELFSAKIEPRSIERAIEIRKCWEDAKRELLDENLQWINTPESVARLFSDMVSIV